MLSLRPAALLLLLSSLAPARAAGQLVRGDVVEQGTLKPVAGAFVRLLDIAGVQHSAMLTDSAGRYALRAPAAGRYQLSAERIGHRTTVSPVLELAAGVVVVHRVVAPTEYIRLEAIRAPASGRCRLPQDAGAETYALWEEIRKALRIVAWRQLDRAIPYQVEQTTLTRELDTQRLLAQERRLRSSLGVTAFRSASAEDLAQNGYVRRTADGDYDYYGLDAQTLLSDAFLDRHCFRIRRPGRQEAGLIGLAFEPLSSRGPPDIAGVLWVDAGRLELRYLEFNFTRHLLPLRVPTDPFGGRVEFMRQASGAWVVRQWWLRMPLFVAPAVLPSRRNRSVPPTLAIRESGARISFADDARAQVEPGGGVLAGLVYDSTLRAPLAGATVFVAGTGRTVRAGPDGRFRIAQLPSGSHRVGFLHPRADSLAVPVAQQRVELRAGEVTSVLLAVPAAAGCAGDGAALVGFVHHAASALPAAGAEISAVWESSAAADSAAAGKAGARADARGRFQLCGLSAPATVRVTAHAGAGGATQTTVTLERPGLRLLDLVVR